LHLTSSQVDDDPKLAANDDPVSGRVVPAPVKKRTREEMVYEEELIFRNLSHEEVNTLILSCFESAYFDARTQGRKYLTAERQEKLLSEVERKTELQFSTFHALQLRYHRIIGNQRVERKSGSGRKSKFTDEIVERTKKILRDSNYEMSFPEAHETCWRSIEGKTEKMKCPGVRSS
jgi:hypothetical protein